MKNLDESLSAYAKVRVSVSLDARVMAQVRAAAVRRAAEARVGTRQIAMLLSAVLGIVLVEASGWIGVARSVRVPRLAPLNHALLQILYVTLQLVKIAEQFLQATVSGLAIALTSPLGMAATLGVVLLVSFMAVSRARRPAVARGL